MAHRTVLFLAEARDKLLRGATALADAIRLTIGPQAKCVLIQKKWGKPLVCDDGVTIAKEFDLKDPDENLGAQVIREAAEKTGDAVGDGTSTATVLAHAIYSEGLRNIAAGASAVDLKRGLDRGLRVAVEKIKSLSRPVSSRKERAQVATISAHNDSVLGRFGRRRDGKGGSRRRGFRGRSQGDGDLGRCRRRNAIRPWILVALLHYRPRKDASDSRRTADFDLREKDH